MSDSERIIVVGARADARVTAARTLDKAGFSKVEAKARLDVGDDDRIDLLLIVGEDASVLCAEAREVPVLAETPILAIVPSIPPTVATEALAAGADDIVVAPASPAVLGNRVRTLLARGQDRSRARELDSLQRAMLKVQTLMARGGDAPDVMREVLLVVVDTMGFDRASLIAHIEASEYAYVVAATDDPSHQNFALAIADYPELTRAIRTISPVLIDDAQSDSITESAADALAAKGIRGVAVFPVVWRKQPLGAVLFRRAKLGVDHLTEDRVAFGQLFANTVAAQLRHGTMIERLRDQTRRISRASYEAERRLRTIESLKEHFEASADGTVVLDEDGHILFVNGTAEAITGFARDGLVGSPLQDLVDPSQRDPLREVIRGVLGGTNLEAFDLIMTTTSGQPICVSVTTSTVLSKSGAVILSFRDVTAQRQLEAELHSTKDFLEKLFDSTVDAIISADLRGRVILFNPGAQRIYGYTQHQVIGRIPVWRLYPEGVAKQVMRMLRSTNYGGVGKLEQTRREVLTKDGEIVPVNMTASIIYEEGREVATVGIFSDLRERLRIEQRLLQAQEQLELQERQAMVAQLAGAAAHELNQPLTSIMAYTEMIKRNIDVDDPSARAVSVLEREAERMADIVKKIGRITRYETKEYVGEASIIDLDKSAASSGEFVRMEEHPDFGEGEIDREIDDFDEEATRQFDAFDREQTRQFDAVSAEKEVEAQAEEHPFRNLVVAIEDEERTSPSLKVGPYKSAAERAREAEKQAEAEADAEAEAAQEGDGEAEIDKNGDSEDQPDSEESDRDEQRIHR